MKILVSTYTFDASAKQITIPAYNPLVLERILLVTNVTDGVILYNFADPLKGGSVATNVLTLEFDTTGMDDTDDLQIFYDDPLAEQPVSLDTLPLPTDAATLTQQIVEAAIMASIDTFIQLMNAKIPELGQALAAGSTPVVLTAAQLTALSQPANGQSNMAGSKPVVIASDQSDLPVRSNFITSVVSTSTVQAIGTIDVGLYRHVAVQITSQGTSSTVAFQTSNDNVNWVTQLLQLSSTTTAVPSSATTTVGLYYGTLSGRYFRLNVTGISAGTTAATMVFSTLPAPLNIAGVNIGGNVTTLSGASTNAAAPSTAMPAGVLGAYAQPAASGAENRMVTMWADRFGRVMVAQKAQTSTLSNVASSATNVTILASNNQRLGGQIYNDSTQVLYIKFGVTASATSFTHKLQPDEYYEIPAGYTGIIDGLWASANGFARVTEET